MLEDIYFILIYSSPDTASYIQKLEREREAREKGEIKDNRSFLAKYVCIELLCTYKYIYYNFNMNKSQLKYDNFFQWMYIVPIAIFVMISGATNPEPAGQASR